MDVDQDLSSLTLKFAEAAVRNTASAVSDRISVARTRKKQEETIAELEQIIADLVADKSELVQVASAYEEELIAQRISPDDVTFISDHIVPLVTKWVESGNGTEADSDATKQQVELMKPLLSAKTVMVLQLLGFNFRRAIGEPLTEVVHELVSGLSPMHRTRAQEPPQLGANRANPGRRSSTQGGRK